MMYIYTGYCEYLIVPIKIIIPQWGIPSLKGFGKKDITFIEKTIDIKNAEARAYVSRLGRYDEACKCWLFDKTTQGAAVDQTGRFLDSDIKDYKRKCSL